MDQKWQGQASILGGPDLMQVLLEIRDNQRRLLNRVERAEDAIERLLSGFPSDDVDGHRRYHESVIEWRELRNRLVRAALEKAVGAGVLAGAGWILLALWQSFKFSVAK